MEPISSTGRRESVLNVRNVMNDLERIEERHISLCQECDMSYPCDVLKLARALNAVVADSKGDGPINRGLNSVQEAERVLREVANE